MSRFDVNYDENELEKTPGWDDKGAETFYKEGNETPAFVKEARQESGFYDKESIKNMAGLASKTEPVKTKPDNPLGLSGGGRVFSTPPPEKPPSLRQKYVEFAKKYKKLNNFITASIKTCLADLVIQVGVEGKTFTNYNWKRCIVFFLYGGVFRSQLQYWF